MQLPALHLDPLQVLDAVQEGHRRQVAQLLGHPKAHIGRPGDQRGVGVGQIPVRQFVAVARAGTRREAACLPDPPRIFGQEKAQSAVIQSGTGAPAAASAARTIGRIAGAAAQVAGQHGRRGRCAPFRCATAIDTTKPGVQKPHWLP